MRTGPIDATAYSAGLELELCLENIWRDQVFCLFARNLLQQLVAGKAPREQPRQGFRPSRRKNLAYLLLHFFALEKNKPAYGSPDQKASVPGKENSPLLARKRDQLIVGVAI